MSVDNAELSTRIGARLREGCAHAGCTERELARFSGLSEQTIRRLEHGQTVPRVGTVEILALGLGTTINRWIGS